MSLLTMSPRLRLREPEDNPRPIPATTFKTIDKLAIQVHHQVVLRCIGDRAVASHLVFPTQSL